MSAYIPTGRTVAKIKLEVARGVWVSRSTKTRDPATRTRMQAMVRELGGRGARAWDVLARVATREWSLLDLYERYQAARGDLAVLREQAEDVELATLVPAFRDAVAKRASDDTAAHYVAAVEALIAGGVTHRSHLSDRGAAGRLTRWVSALPGAKGTRRKKAAGVSAFCTFLVLDGLLAHNPMREVRKPAGGKRYRFLTEPEMLTLITAMPIPERGLSALIHGTGLDVSAALAIEAGALAEPWTFLHTRPKTGHRHTVVVATWARPFLVELVRGKLPRALVGTGVDRYRLGKAHRAACRACGIVDYWLRDARHSWAVRHKALGGSDRDGAEQLGHRDGGVLFGSLYSHDGRGVEDRQAAETRAARRAAR